MTTWFLIVMLWAGDDVMGEMYGFTTQQGCEDAAAYANRFFSDLYDERMSATCWAVTVLDRQTQES